MSEHVFVDETKAHGVLLTAAALAPGQLVTARRVMRAFVMPGQRRIHFTSEGDGRRKKILDGIGELNPAVIVYDGSALPGRQQREACLRALVADIGVSGARILVLERDDSIVAMDNRILYQRVREVGCTELRYQHLRAHEEPLLAIPDAVAWCWQRGGQWRERVQEMVTEVRTLGVP